VTAAPLQWICDRPPRIPPPARPCAPFEELAEAALEDKLARADAAYRVHRKTPLADRARWLNNLAGILESEKDRLGRIMTLE